MRAAMIIKSRLRLAIPAKTEWVLRRRFYDESTLVLVYGTGCGRGVVFQYHRVRDIPRRSGHSPNAPPVETQRRGESAGPAQVKVAHPALKRESLSRPPRPPQSGENRDRHIGT